MEKLELLKKRINHIERDLINAKGIIIKMNNKNKQKTADAWKDLQAASKEISKRWKGPSVVEDIRKQREKN